MKKLDVIAWIVVYLYRIICIGVVTIVLSILIVVWVTAHPIAAGIFFICVVAFAALTMLAFWAEKRVGIYQNEKGAK